MSVQSQVCRGLYQLLLTTVQVTSLLGNAGSTGNPPIYIGRAPKQPPTPFLVIHKISQPPAGQTLDGVTALIDGEFQFDSYADDALAAQLLSRTVKQFFLPPGGPNYGGTLPDNTEIQFTEVTADLDDGYELGGESYLFRSILRLAAMYTEEPD